MRKQILFILIIQNAYPSPSGSRRYCACWRIKARGGDDGMVGD